MERGSAFGEGLTRRQLLLGAGAAVGLGALVPASASNRAAVEPGAWVTGIVQSVEPPNVLRILGLEGSGETVIELSKGATLGRDGEASSLAVFEPGDEVYAEGKWGEGVFVATELSVLWQEIAGRIESVKGALLTTAAGSLLLRDNTRVSDARGASSSARPKVGDYVVATGPVDKSGTLVAEVVEVRKPR